MFSDMKTRWLFSLPLAWIAAGLAHSVLAAEQPDETGALRQQGEQVAAALFGSLGGTLQKQIAENGVEAAIGFCKAAALPLTAETQAKFENVQSVRRVGVRTRNPANLPDPDDTTVLEEMLKGWSRNAPSVEGIFREVKTDTGAIRYYKPVTTMATCLACHGSPDQIAPNVLAAIRKSYPDDQAVNFAEGDLRGAIVVTFSEAPKSP